MSKKSNTIEFIEKAIEIHEDKYNYDLVNYINAHIKVKINCSIHGIFEITPNKHLSRRCGCPKCGRVKQFNALRSNIDIFIKKANKVHNFKYNYNFSKYITAHSKIDIFCNKHGIFKQTPSKHLCGDGCPSCGFNSIAEKASLNPTGWSYTNWLNVGLKSKNFDSFKVYIIECWNKDEKFYKIGRTFQTIKKRLSHIPYKWKIIKVYEGKAIDMCKLEIKLKNKNKEHNYKPSIKFHGSKECFTKIKEI